MSWRLNVKLLGSKIVVKGIQQTDCESYVQAAEETDQSWERIFPQSQQRVLQNIVQSYGLLQTNKRLIN